MSSYTKTLGQRIKQRMQTHSMSADMLANSVGASPATISRILSGTAVNTQWSVLEAIADTLNVSINYLLDTRHPPAKLTNIKTIDHAITTFYENLFLGNKGLEKINRSGQQLIDPDYRLLYIDNPDVSMDFAKEMESNTNEKGKFTPAISIRSADLYNPRTVIIHIVLSSSHLDPPSNVALHGPITTTQNLIMDIWELSVNINEIRKGKSFLLVKRSLKNIGRLGGNVELW